MTIFDFSQSIKSVKALYTSIEKVSNPEKIEATIKELSIQASAPDIWNEPEKAQKINSQLSHSQNELSTLRSLATRIEDVEFLGELAETEGDEASFKEVMNEVENLKISLEKLEIGTLLSGPYDEREAVITIRSGVGGDDAADFAQMLLRMYLRWAEKHGYSTEMMDTSYAEIAGIKSATFEVKAPYAFGRLSVEAGTHRLVRISPFGTKDRRQTSFAAVEVIPLIAQTDHLEVPETELKIDVFRSSGPGGQSVNTTDSAVRITHIPTGIVVSMQNEKSQIQNKAAAMRIVQSRLLLLKQEQEKAEKKELAGDVKASWGDQVRSYVLNPYQMVKDLRTEYEVGNTASVLEGEIDGFIDAGIRWKKQQEQG